MDFQVSIVMIVISWNTPCLISFIKLYCILHFSLCCFGNYKGIKRIPIFHDKSIYAVLATTMRVHLMCESRNGNKKGMKLNHSTIREKNIQILTWLNFGFHGNKSLILILIPISGKSSKNSNGWDLEWVFHFIPYFKFQTSSKGHILTCHLFSFLFLAPLSQVIQL